jgi:hypothetical protein
VSCPRQHTSSDTLKSIAIVIAKNSSADIWIFTAPFVNCFPPVFHLAAIMDKTGFKTFNQVQGQGGAGPSTAGIYLVPIHKWLICPISDSITGLCEKFYPRNINHMPAVKFFACLDLDQIGHFWMGTI